MAAAGVAVRSLDLPEGLELANDALRSRALGEVASGGELDGIL